MKNDRFKANVDKLTDIKSKQIEIQNDNRNKLSVGKSPQIVNYQMNKTKPETVKPKTNVKKAVNKTRSSNNNQNKPDVSVADKSNTKKRNILVSQFKNDKTKVNAEQLTDGKSKQIKIQKRNNTNKLPIEKKPQNANDQTNKTKAEILQLKTSVKKRVEKTRQSNNNQNKPDVVAKPDTEKQVVQANQVKNVKTKDNVDKLIDVKSKQNEIQKRDMNKVPAEKIPQNTNDQTNKIKVETIKPETKVKKHVEKTRLSTNNNQNKPGVVAKSDMDNQEDPIQVKTDKTKVDDEKLTHGKPKQIEIQKDNKKLPDKKPHNMNVIRTNITKSETVQAEKNVTNSEEEVGITQSKNGTQKKLEKMNLNTPVVKLKNHKSNYEEMDEKNQSDQGLILNSAKNAKVTELLLQGTSGLSTEVDVDEVPDGDVRENAWEDNEGSSVGNRDMSAEHSRPTDVNRNIERHEQTNNGNGTEYSEDESQGKNYSVILVVFLGKP